MPNQVLQQGFWLLGGVPQLTLPKTVFWKKEKSAFPAEEKLEPRLSMKMPMQINIHLINQTLSLAMQR